MYFEIQSKQGGVIFDIREAKVLTGGHYKGESDKMW